VAVVAAVVYGISAVFPVAAGLARDTSNFPGWWGPADVGLALVLALLAFAVLGVAHDRIDNKVEERAYHGYRHLIHAIFVVLVIFVFWGDRIVWSQCLSGITWRFWLLLYVLPYWLAAFGDGRERVDNSK
jgi:hypothetical protein